MTDVWTQKADSPLGERRKMVAFSIGTKGYAGTGYLNVGGYPNQKDFWEYDPSTNSWTQKTDLGGATRYSAAGFSIGDKGYIGTGHGQAVGVYQKDFWEYDPSTNLWTQKADFGGPARFKAVGFSIGTKGYMGMGKDSAYRKDFWEYDPSTNSWTQKTDLGGAVRGDAVGFGIGDKGYIGVGAYYSGGYVYLNDFWEYDPSTNLWTQKANYGGGGRMNAAGFSIGDKGYIGSGSDSSQRKDFWEYDPSTNSWTQKANYGGGDRNTVVGFSIEDKGYMGMGMASVVKKDFWEWCCGEIPVTGRRHRFAGGIIHRSIH